MLIFGPTTLPTTLPYYPDQKPHWLYVFRGQGNQGNTKTYTYFSIDIYS